MAYITVWLVGDSTMADKEIKAYPETGWGMPFAYFFDSTVKVVNTAKNGRSTGSFIQEGRWDAVEKGMKEGDYVLIQFGHNDEVPTKGSYTPPADFEANLIRFVSAARVRKVVPVLITPVARRKFDAAGVIQETHAEYAAIVRRVAAEHGVALIDLDKESLELLQKLGPEGSKALFNYLEPGEHPNYPAGRQDDTHFSELGARKMAEIVVRDLKNLKVGLETHMGANNREGKRITVARDGSGDFTTVQAAFDAVPLNNQRPVTIYVRDGVYREKLHLDSTKRWVTLLGESRFGTILTYDDHPGMVNPQGDSVNTRNSYSCRISADDFCARNICFRNDAGFSAGQAVGVEARGDRLVFEGCRIVGNQDILYLNSVRSRQVYKDCYIEGTTDFIFGSATAWFAGCHIHSKKNSYVTAASTPMDHPYGFVFYDCSLTADPGLDRVFLGRPWKPYADVIYMHCYLGAHILPEGWSGWNKTDNWKTARYAEYADYGPGGAAGGRVGWSKQLSEKEAGSITPQAVFGDWDVAAYL